jgi:hypothetical protein
MQTRAPVSVPFFRKSNQSTRYTSLDSIRIIQMQPFQRFSFDVVCPFGAVGLFRYEIE